MASPNILKMFIVFKKSSYRLSYVSENNNDSLNNVIEFVNSEVTNKTATEYLNVTSSQIISKDKKTTIAFADKCKILLLALLYRTISFRAIAQYLISGGYWTTYSNALKDKELICVEGFSTQDYFHIWYARQHGLKILVVVPFIFAIPCAYHVTSIVLTSDCVEDEYRTLGNNVRVVGALSLSENRQLDPTKKIGLGFGSDVLVSDQQIINNIKEILLLFSRPKGEWYLSLHPQIRLNAPRLALFKSQLPKSIKIRHRESNKKFLDDIDIIIMERSTFIEELLSAQKFIIVLTNGSVSSAEKKLCAKFPSKLWYCPNINAAIHSLEYLLGGEKIQ